MNSRQAPARFEPVVLDLADPDDYGVLIEALESYAAQLQNSADNGRDTADERMFFRTSAARAKDMVEKIHDQLEANRAIAG